MLAEIIHWEIMISLLIVVERASMDDGMAEIFRQM